jgi:hypothetical protein
MSRKLLVALLLLAGCGGEGQKTFADVPRPDPGPVHVHGLGINPADGALFIATHTGLYRVGASESKAERVGESFQDTMGFTVLGPDRFLGSGHPDVNEAIERNLPPHLGLIESSDAGKTWENVSLLGEADCHVLRLAGERVYCYDASNDRLLASGDRGRSWEELAKPGPLIDLAVDPGDPERLLATTSEGLFESGWRRLGEPVGLLAWPATDRLYLVAAGGQVFESPDGGRTLRHRGEVSGEPAAFLAVASDLYVALHDGTIVRSADRGATWTVRSTP